MQQQYLKTQIVTASKEQLVLLLYDGILRFTEQGKQALIRNEIDVAHTAFMRAQAIIMELVYTLNREEGGEIAENLARLYAYAFNALIVANLQHEPAKVDEVQNIFRGIREGWIGAMRNMGVDLPGEKPADAPASTPAIPAPATSESATPASTPSSPAPKASATYGAGRTAGTSRQPFAPPPARAAMVSAEPRVALNLQG